MYVLRSECALTRRGIGTKPRCSSRLFAASIAVLRRWGHVGLARGRSSGVERLSSWTRDGTAIRHLPETSRVRLRPSHRGRCRIQVQVTPVERHRLPHPETRAGQGGDNRTEIVVGGVKEALYLVANNSPADPFPRPLGWADSDSDSRLQRIPHWRGGDWTILEMRCSSSRAFYVLRIWGAPPPLPGVPVSSTQAAPLRHSINRRERRTCCLVLYRPGYRMAWPGLDLQARVTE
jgi:hypothetical protein